MCENSDKYKWVKYIHSGVMIVSSFLKMCIILFYWFGTVIPVGLPLISYSI